MKKLLKLAILSALITPVATPALTPQEVIEWYSHQCKKVTQTAPATEPVEEVESEKQTSDAHSKRTWNMKTTSPDGQSYTMKYSSNEGASIIFSETQDKKVAMLTVLASAMSRYAEFAIKFTGREQPTFLNSVITNFLIEESEDVPFMCFSNDHTIYTREECLQCVQQLYDLYTQMATEWGITMNQDQTTDNQQNELTQSPALDDQPTILEETSTTEDGQTTALETPQAEKETA